MLNCALHGGLICRRIAYPAPKILEVTNATLPLVFLSVKLSLDLASQTRHSISPSAFDKGFATTSSC